jgi:microcystin-dependent protein
VLVTNQTPVDYWFGPLHLPAGAGQQITVDDTSATSLYLTSDSVADAINNLAASGKITVSGAADPFPRPTGTPQLLHGDGSPNGLVYAPQGSIYMRRDGLLTNGGVIYIKTSGITSNVDWYDLSDALGIATVSPTGSMIAFGGTTAPTGWLICDGSAISRLTYASLFGIIGTHYGAGDGSTTFNLPDLRGRVAAGFAVSGGHPDVSTLGANDGQATSNRRPKHRTTNNLVISDPGHAHNLNYYTSGGATWGVPVNNNGTGPNWANVSGTSVQASGTGVSVAGSIGTNTANDALDTPSYLVVNHIIKT